MKLIIYALLLSILACCGKLEEFEQPHCDRPGIIQADSSTVTLNCSAGLQTLQMRAGVDYILLDVNIYFFSTQWGVSKHIYRTANGSSKMNLKLANGTYNIYVVGNYGSDLGEKTELQLLKEMRAVITSETDIHSAGRRMAMSARQRVTVSGNTSINIALERLAAKVTFNVRISAAFSDGARIVHLQLFNCNARVGHFAQSRISSAAGGGIAKYNKLNVPSTLKALSKDWYIMENMQGTVSKITSPRQRSRENAPIFATYLWLRIERNGKFIDYRVYLGENDTNNFDVRRNTNYIYNIVVAGENSADLRVSSVSLKVYSGEQPASGPSYSPFDRFVWKDYTAYCMLHIVTTNQDPSNIFSVSFAHQSGTFRTGWYISYSCPYVAPQQYRQMREGNSYPIFKGTGTTTVYFSFRNGDYKTHDNVFLFNVADNNGYSKQFTITTATLPR